ncbi:MULTISPECIES: hypothetical protein [Kosmotoga]|jgi:hypothetical protein|uniref:Uncharacterized protein n=1 Tax=Kosmotoga olearia (strain ATCC BAA-1733 / DSM 21960 / TBF 19.5.1) TaxID=521045 RepID=C5CG45_KOSOT|nr:MULTISPECIES: hypothetical protein [Kosmotoga]ACR79486.1 hypothetical protein Kole_0774 [Kosmotoga olearia TBF 19.5.1]
MDYKIIPLNGPDKPKTLRCPVTETLFDCGPEKDAPCGDTCPPGMLDECGSLDVCDTP